MNSNDVLVNHPQPKFVSKSAAAKIIGIGIKALNLLISQGKIRVKFVGKSALIPYAEIKRFTEEDLVSLKSVYNTSRISNQQRNSGSEVIQKAEEYDSRKLFDQLITEYNNG